MNVYKIAEINHGFCRIVYKKKTDFGAFYYCLQNEGEKYGGVILYRCTDDGEPSHPVKIKKEAAPEFELPTGETELEKLCRESIKARRFESEHV